MTMHLLRADGSYTWFMHKDPLVIKDWDLSDRRWALAISGVLHVAAFALIWQGAAGEGLGEANIRGGGGRAGIAMELLSADEFRQRVELLVAPVPLDRSNLPEQLSEAALDEPMISRDGSVDQMDEPKHLEEKVEVSRGATMATNDFSSATLSAAGASAANGDVGGDESMRAAYLRALRAAIRGQWRISNPGSASCSLTLRQSPGGVVNSAASHDCKLDGDARRALEAAALLAQPLPYSGFESAYSDEVTLDF